MKTLHHKPIHDIFSKRNSPEKEIKKEKILVDYREKNCLVPSEIVKCGCEVEFRELKVADYIVKDTAVERKTINDFISSMINRHLINQLAEMQQFENRLLIIEGIKEQELYSDNKVGGVNANAIRGFLLSISLRHKVPIIFTKDEEDTARFICVLAKKESSSENPLNVNKKTLDKNEQLQKIIEAFPGVGPKTAKKLLQEFKTIKNILNSDLESLEKILGKKSELMKEIIEREYKN
jgi:Fanconi anemia group M protein